MKLEAMSWMSRTEGNHSKRCLTESGSLPLLHHQGGHILAHQTARLHGADEALDTACVPDSLRAISLVQQNVVKRPSWRLDWIAFPDLFMEPTETLSLPIILCNARSPVQDVREAARGQSGGTEDFVEVFFLLRRWIGHFIEDRDTEVWRGHTPGRRVNSKGSFLIWRKVEPSRVWDTAAGEESDMKSDKGDRLGSAYIQSRLYLQVGELKRTGNNELVVALFQAKRSIWQGVYRGHGVIEVEISFGRLHHVVEYTPIPTTNGHGI